MCIKYFWKNIIEVNDKCYLGEGKWVVGDQKFLKKRLNYMLFKILEPCEKVNVLIKKRENEGKAPYTILWCSLPWPLLWPGMQKTKDQIPDSLACYMTLRGHLNCMGLISIIYKIEMTFAVSESNYSDEHIPYVVDNTC